MAPDLVAFSGQLTVMKSQNDLLSQICQIHGIETSILQHNSFVNNSIQLRYM